MSFGSDGLPNEKEIVKGNVKRYPVLCSRDQALISLVLSVIISSGQPLKNLANCPYLLLSGIPWTTRLFADIVRACMVSLVYSIL